LSEAGTGIPRNYQTAKNWYKKAADLGNADAMGNLGALGQRRNDHVRHQPSD
jgi:TPR repeat protein